MEQETNYERIQRLSKLKGWISPLGVFFPIEGEDHDSYAKENFGHSTLFLERRGWIQTLIINDEVQILQMTNHGGYTFITKEQKEFALKNGISLFRTMDK